MPHISQTFYYKICKDIYRVSQEECARLREGVPYVKVHLYNPKHLCPKLKGYGDNGQRKVWSSGGSTHCTCQLTVLSMSVLECGVICRSIDEQYCAIIFLERQNNYATIQSISASATQSLLMRAENCIAAGVGHFEQLLCHECECFCSSI
jgi:hypothetical protein